MSTHDGEWLNFRQRFIREDRKESKIFKHRTHCLVSLTLEQSTSSIKWYIMTFNAFYMCVFLVLMYFCLVKKREVTSLWTFSEVTPSVCSYVFWIFTTLAKKPTPKHKHILQDSWIWFPQIICSGIDASSFFIFGVQPGHAIAAEEQVWRAFIQRGMQNCLKYYSLHAELASKVGILENPPFSGLSMRKEEQVHPQLVLVT